MSDNLDRLRTAVAGRYDIHRLVGTGGMATVYLADDLRHRRKVAVKVLQPEVAAAIGAERFLAEIRVTAGLQHPNILPLYDSGEADGLLYYVMPLIEGESLRERISREKQLQVDQAIAIIRSIAGAIDFAHARGVVHRDIKPENILLQDGQPMVADFGIALAMSVAAGARLTETGIALGTPHYMSPEQALGDRDLDARSDVYALGAMLYEMLAGKPPFDAATVQGIIGKIVAEPAAPVRLDRPTVPVNVDAAIGVALQKLPADRFQTARGFAEALVNPSYVAPGSTQAVLAAARPASWKEKLALPVVAVAVLTTMLAGWALTRPAAVTTPQILRYRMSLPPQELLTTRYASRVVLSPDGSRLVYMGPSPQGVQLWVRRRDQLEAQPIPGTESAAAPFFSPDGQRVGFLNVGRQSLHAVALDGGAKSVLVPSGVRRVGAAWGEDGIVYVDDKRGLVRLREGDPLSAATVLLSLDQVPDPRWPQVLRDGKGVIFTRFGGGGAESEIAAIAEPGASPRALVRGIVGLSAPNRHLVYVTATSELMAVPFDPNRLELTGPPAVVARDVELQFGAVDVTTSNLGTLIYGVATGRDLSDLVWTDRAGTARVLDPNWTGDFQAVSISPEGRRLAVTIIDGESLSVWVKQLAGGPAARLTLDSDRSFRATWHPSGKTVGFIVERGDTRQFFQRSADGSGATELGFPESTNQAEWSKDSKWLIYRTGRVDDLNIFARRLADNTTVELATNPAANEHSPALSPDGKWLAFVSNRTGGWQVYVRPFPNAGDGEWQVSSGGGSEPRWAHSGRELFYKEGRELVAAEVVAGPAFAVGRRQPLFSLQGYYNFSFHPTYDVAPDDRHFAMIRSRHIGEQFDLVVIDHWQQEFSSAR